MTRKEINDALAAWVKARAAAHAQDIALVVLYGSYINGTANERSDIDLYFVPENERAADFAETFILAGVGYDIYPRSFDNLAALASLENPLTPCLADVQILHGDASRLLPYQKKLAENLANPAYMHTIAKKRFQWACCDRRYPGYTLMGLSEVLAAWNGTYFHFGIKRQYEELAEMKWLPTDFLSRYDALVQKPTRENADALLLLVGEYCGFEVTAEETFSPAPPMTAKAVCSLYEEICSTFGKIYTAAEQGNARLAYLAASCLQGELDCTGWELPSVISAWSTGTLSAFAAHSVLSVLMNCSSVCLTNLDPAIFSLRYL